MNYNDPYQAYAEGNVYSGNPLRLVVALYEGAIDCVRQAKQCLLTGDVWGRNRAINKASRILTELLVSLDHEKGGEVSANLKRLYGYMQSRLLEAHAQQSREPMDETERLLTTLLEGWLGASEKMEQFATDSPNQSGSPATEPGDRSVPYGCLEEATESAYGLCTTF